MVFKKTFNQLNLKIKMRCINNYHTTLWYIIIHIYGVYMSNMYMYKFLTFYIVLSLINNNYLLTIDKLVFKNFTLNIVAAIINNYIIFKIFVLIQCTKLTVTNIIL